MNKADDRFQTIAGQTVVDRKMGAAMHSRVGAWNEANAIYVQRSQLAKRAALDSIDTGQPLRVLDVGMGIAANALALVEAWGQTASNRPLELTSVESEIGGMSSALEQTGAFDFVERHRGTLKNLLAEGSVEDTRMRMRWSLLNSTLEDALGALESESFDLIYYDLYGPAEQPAAWELKLLAPTAQLLKPGSGVLLTYASATRIRSALILAGLRVCSVPATQLKKEMTLAHVDSLPHDLLPVDATKLGQSFFDHLQRSQRPWPDDLPAEKVSESWLLLKNALLSNNI